MKKRFIFFYSLILILSLLLASCSSINAMTGGSEPTAEANLPPEEIIPSEGSISVEGRLIPKQTAQLAFATVGQVEEIWAFEGDTVAKGDVIATLVGKEQLEATVAAAEFELFSAQQARNALDADLESNQNLALQALNTARQAVHDNERRADGLGKPASQADIDIAYSQVVFAKKALDDAKEKFDPYANKPENNLTRARLQIDLSNAQKAYDAAVQLYNGFIGATNDFDRIQILTDFEISRNQLALAQEEYDMLQKGPDPDLVASTEARIQAAESRLAATKADLEKLSLLATIDGKIVNSELNVGQTVSPGEPLVLLADFSEWHVETENLTEIEVVDIANGQKVTVSPDALPETNLAGEVIEISDTYQEKRGEITYTVLIKLDETDPRLRWGMTVVVNFND